MIDEEPEWGKTLYTTQNKLVSHVKEALEEYNAKRQGKLLNI